MSKSEPSGVAATPPVPVTGHGAGAADATGRSEAVRIALFYAALFLIYGVQVPYLPVWLDAQGLDASQVAFVAAAPFFVRVIVTPIVSLLADARANHRAMVIGIAGLALAAALALTRASGFVPILLAATLMMVCGSTVMPLAETVAVEAVRRRGADYGRMRLWGSATFIVASYAGGLLVERLGGSVVVWLLVVGAVATVLAALGLPGSDGAPPGASAASSPAPSSAMPRPNAARELAAEELGARVVAASASPARGDGLPAGKPPHADPLPGGEREQCAAGIRATVHRETVQGEPHQPAMAANGSVGEAETSALAAARRLVRAPLFLVFLVAAGATQASHAMLYTFGALNWRAHGISTDWVGILWAIGVLVEIGLFAYAKPLAARFGIMRLMALGALACVVRWAVLAFDPPLAVLIPLQVLHGLTYGATHVTAIKFIARAVPQAAAGTAQGLYATIAAGIGHGAATIVSGRLYAAHGAYGYLAMAALAAVGLAAALVLWRRWDGGPLWAAQVK